MERDLVAIKVTVGIRSNGHADHPNFNHLPVLQDMKAAGQEMDWAHYVSVHGLSNHYDKICGHAVHAPDVDPKLDSPAGTQWCVFVIPKEFADQAVAFDPSILYMLTPAELALHEDGKLPQRIFKLTEAELEDFYDNRAHAHEPDETMDEVVVSRIEAKAIEDRTPAELRALDPDDPAPGVRKNVRKTWALYKESVGGVNIV